tara:strand:- start:237 stop:773 length:537 start_codon:yes stop_codon:yes gene_type:complete
LRNKPNRIDLQLADGFYQIEIKDISAMLEKNGVKILNASPAGSLRRKKRSIGDLDIVIEVDNPELAGQLLEKHMNYSYCNKNAFYKGSIHGKTIDLFIAGKHNFYAMLFFLTGSEDWNLKIMKHLTANTDTRYSAFKFKNIKTKEIYHFDSEEEIFKLIEHSYIQPENRNPRNIKFGE